MSRIVVIGALPESLILFRLELLKSLVSGGHEVTAMSAPARDAVVKELSRAGVSFRSYPVERSGMNPLKDLRTCCALRTALQELQPRIVLSYTIKPIIWAGMALKGASSPRFYALVTGLGFTLQEGGSIRGILKRFVSFLYRLSLTRASGVIFQNPDNRDFFVSNRIISGEKCSVVNGSGVDLSHFVPTPLTGEETVFLAIGRLLGEKGFREYAQAARIVKKLYPGTIFRLVGPLDPSPDGIPLKEIMQWQARGWIEYGGETTDVRPMLSDCHVYVLPSYHEGMPRTVLEAMAMGRPVLTTNVPGCRETVRQGVNGFLVPAGDAAALAGKMQWMIEHRRELKEMGMQGRAMAEARFDVHAVNREMLKIMGLAPP